MEWYEVISEEMSFWFVVKSVYLGVVKKTVISEALLGFCEMVCMCYDWAGGKKKKRTYSFISALPITFAFGQKLGRHGTNVYHREV